MNVVAITNRASCRAVPAHRRLPMQRSTRPSRFPDSPKGHEPPHYSPAYMVTHVEEHGPHQYAVGHSDTDDANPDSRRFLPKERPRPFVDPRATLLA